MPNRTAVPLVLLALLLVAGGCGGEPTLSSTSALDEKPFELDRWAHFAAGTHVLDVAGTGAVRWIATTDGLIRYEVASHTRHRFNTSNSGLPSNRVEDVAVVSDRSVWILTDRAERLLHFDPTGPTRYDRWQFVGAPELPFFEENLTALAVGPDSNLWVANGESVGRLRPDRRFRAFPKPPEADEGALKNHRPHIDQIAFGTDGRIWMGSHNLLLSLDPENASWTSHRATTDEEGFKNPVRDIEPAASGGVWAIGRRTLHLVQDGSTTTYDLDDVRFRRMRQGYQTHQSTLVGLETMDDGTLVALTDSGFLTWQDGEWHHKLLPRLARQCLPVRRRDEDGMMLRSAHDQATVFHLPSASSAWIGTKDHGVAFVRSSNQRRLNHPEAFPEHRWIASFFSNTVKTIVAGRSALWMVTGEFPDTYGAARFDPQASTPGERLSIYPAPASELYRKVDDGGGLYRDVGRVVLPPDRSELKDRSPMARDTPSPGTPFAEATPDAEVTDLVVETDRDVVWTIIVDRSGSRLRRGTSEDAWTTVPVGAGLSEAELTALALGPEGTLYVGTRAGLASYDGTQWTALRRDTHVRDVAVGPDGAVWLVSNETVLHRADGTWSTFAPAEHGARIKGWGQRVAVDGQERAWVNFEDHTTRSKSDRLGLARMDGPRDWAALDRTPGHAVNDMATDPAGRVWIASWHGPVFRWGAPPSSNDTDSPQDGERVEEGPPPRPWTSAFPTRRAPLPDDADVVSISFDGDSTLWMATGLGVFAYNENGVPFAD